MGLIESFIEYKSKTKNLKNETLELYYSDIKNFEETLDIELIEVENKDILKYVETLKKYYQINSVVRKLSSLKMFYKYLVEKRIIIDNPTDGIKIEKATEKETEVLKEWEINSILAACENNFKGMRDRIFIKLLVYTGLSINDILNVLISDLEIFSYEYIFEEKKERKVHLSIELADELRYYVEKVRVKNIIADTDYVFEGLSRQGFRARFIALGKKCGIEREISPSFLLNTVKELEKEKEEVDEIEFFSKLRELYFKIGIGDD